MLEQQGLLLRPWRLAAPADKSHQAAAALTEPGTRNRDVLDLASGRELGFVRARQSPVWRGFRWLARRILEAYETEDASLVCSVTRSWGLAWGWEVCDAEERRVAVVYRRLIVHSTGRALAVTEWPAESSPGHFLNPRGTELGSFTSAPEGTSVTFAAILDGDPFSRMALLGAVLSYEW